MKYCVCSCFVCQAEEGIRDLVRSRGLGDVYKRQPQAAFGQATDAIVVGTVTDPTEAAVPNASVEAQNLSLIHI